MGKGLAQQFGDSKASGVCAPFGGFFVGGCALMVKITKKGGLL
jgi:hypothetical protein